MKQALNVNGKAQCTKSCVEAESTKVSVCGGLSRSSEEVR